MAQDHGHTVVYGFDQIIGFSRDDGEAFHFASVRLPPCVLQSCKGERLFIFEINPHGNLALSFFPPFVESVGGNDAPTTIHEMLEGRQFRECLGSRVYHAIADGRVRGPIRDQPPVHEPALIAAPLPDNHGNRRGHLFGSNVKTWLVLWQIAVKVPANSYVAKFKRSCDTAAHSYELLLVPPDN